jgi:hypothetical protein
MGLVICGYLTDVATVEGSWRYHHPYRYAKPSGKEMRELPAPNNSPAPTNSPAPNNCPVSHNTSVPNNLPVSDGLLVSNRPPGFDNLPAALVWIQRGCRVEGQDFPAYTIWKPSEAGDGDMAIHASIRNENAMDHW